MKILKVGVEVICVRQAVGSKLGRDTDTKKPMMRVE
jgi:hypothetical protein